MYRVFSSPVYLRELIEFISIIEIEINFIHKIKVAMKIYTTTDNCTFTLIEPKKNFRLKTIKWKPNAIIAVGIQLEDGNESYGFFQAKVNEAWKIIVDSNVKKTPYKFTFVL